MRRLLLRLVRWLAEALVRLYYPARAVEGAERIPAGAPLVFVLNHPNGLLDPLLLRITLGVPARFLAKSTLFGNPSGRLAMDAFDTIPIYRAHEVKDANKDGKKDGTKDETRMGSRGTRAATRSPLPAVGPSWRRGARWRCSPRGPRIRTRSSVR